MSSLSSYSTVIFAISIGESLIASFSLSDISLIFCITLFGDFLIESSSFVFTISLVVLFSNLSNRSFIFDKFFSKLDTVVLVFSDSPSFSSIVCCHILDLLSISSCWFSFSMARLDILSMCAFISSLSLSAISIPFAPSLLKFSISAENASNRCLTSI